MHRSRMIKRLDVRASQVANSLEGLEGLWLAGLP